MSVRFMRFGIACLLLGTTITWAEPWDEEEQNFGQQTYNEGSIPQPRHEEESFGAQQAYNEDSVQQPTLLSLKNQIQRQNERIDGLTTLVEGLSTSLMELQQAKATSTGGGDNTELLQKLSTMIDKINGEYVSRSELDRRLSGKSSVSTPSSSYTAPASIAQDTSLESQPPATLYSEGVRSFGKKRYDDAKKRFLIADTKGYKPAASNYYLGECAYYTGKYEDAIFYFKKSAGLYDKAEYIDVLLLHTAISLERTGNKDQAKLFYQNIIDNYGGRKSAQIAKDNIRKL